MKKSKCEFSKRIKLAQNVVQLISVVNTVTNHPFPEKAKTFDQVSNHQLLKLTMFHGASYNK